MNSTRMEHVTCLGCGCGCDDIAVTVREDRIIETSPACPVGRGWFGDGSVPWEVLSNGKPVALEEALTLGADLLLQSRGRVLVCIGPDVTTQAHAGALAIADLLHATVDTATSDTAAAGLLAAQRRGRATATLGEIRNRGDVVVFWGTDPARRYPRFHSRYAPDPAGIQVPKGRASRFVVAVNIGADQGPPGADATLTLEPQDETAALSLMRAALLDRRPAELTPRMTQVLDLVPRLTAARYVVLVHDAEPTAEPRNPFRAEGLIALALALNGPTRAALCSLRAGGNRVGIESVLTWQTGYPFAVNFSRGIPRYAPGERGLDRLGTGRFGAALLVGTPELDDKTLSKLGDIDTIVIGPRASQSSFNIRVAVDTGVAGIHEGGTGYRMDEVPLSLRPPLSSRRPTLEVLRSLAGRIRGEGKQP